MTRFLKFCAWTLLGLLMVSLVLGGLLAGFAHDGLQSLGDSAHGSWHVVVDGEEVLDTDDLHVALGGDQALGFAGLVAGLAVAVFSVLVLVPLVLLLGVGLPLFGVLLGIGLVVVSLTGVAALLLTPLVLPVLLVVWLVRRKRPAPAVAPSAAA